MKTIVDPKNNFKHIAAVVNTDFLKKTICKLKIGPEPLVIHGVMWGPYNWPSKWETSKSTWWLNHPNWKHMQVKMDQNHFPK